MSSQNTTWRLEPTPRNTAISEGLAARIHDPLWLLARQWQVGEFEAQDAGTPVLVNVSGSSSPINAWRGAQQTDWTPFDGSIVPLDSLVEAEDDSGPDLRERVEAGAQFIRRLRAANLEAVVSAFVQGHPFAASDLTGPDFSGDPLLAAVAQRTPDGLPLFDTATALANGQPQSAVTIDPSALPQVSQVATDWLTWYNAEVTVPVGSGTTVTWQENRLEYGFAAASPAAGGTVLVADQYMGDGVDWYDFDIDPTATVGPNGTAVPISATAVPTPVRYRGMPLPRFWAMEDSSYDYGSIEAAPNDIGRLLLVEFATVFGNNWHILPLKIPVGSLTLMDSVIVSDVFGRNLVLGRAGHGEPQWNLFSLDTKSGTHAAQDALFVPPSAAYLTQSSPVETVLFLRDEVADLAWGVETRVENGLQKVIDRRSTWVAPAKLPSGTRDFPAYRVETVVPDYWIPFAPEQLPGKNSPHFRLIPIEADVGGTPQLIGPRGRLLLTNQANTTLWVFEEEIPREGTQVDRLYRYARWQDGRTSVWSARRRQTGSGEGSSGLRFDILDPD